MPSFVASVRSWRLPRAFALAFIASGAAACSDSTRFNDNPFSRSQPAEVTGSVQRGQPAPAGRVQTSQLPPPTGSRPATVAPGSGVSGGGRGLASYQPGQPDPAVTGTVQSRPPQTAPAVASPVVRQAPSRAASRPASGQHVHVVAPGDTLYKISRMYKKPLVEIARANNIAPHSKLNIGDRLVIPGGARVSRLPRKDTPKIAQAKQLGTTAAPKAAPKAQRVAARSSAPTTESASVVTPSASAPAPQHPVRAASAAPSFRWPAKGRIIAGYGPRTNGQQNDGINLALPEGTPVKAAEDGVVAYAGNELKGYGNLVLVRHSNGYVTAYAHAKELLVKRGDPIKRGQVIARSGQTGNVDGPQLHFEIRKGPTPLDPVPLLSGG
ncbi:MAG: peptidoglycan DD-metalloendopeptidase family protein [Xanthobacteraceae bacterium]